MGPFSFDVLSALHRHIESRPVKVIGPFFVCKKQLVDSVHVPLCMSPLASLGKVDKTKSFPHELPSREARDLSVLAFEEPNPFCLEASRLKKLHKPGPSSPAYLLLRMLWRS